MCVSFTYTRFFTPFLGATEPSRSQLPRPRWRSSRWLERRQLARRRADTGKDGEAARGCEGGEGPGGSYMGGTRHRSPAPGGP